MIDTTSIPFLFRKPKAADILKALEDNYVTERIKLLEAIQHKDWYDMQIQYRTKRLASLEQAIKEETQHDPKISIANRFANLQQRSNPEDLIAKRDPVLSTEHIS